MGTLSIVATPIGNLQDLSPRAREVLTSVDLILCEDTRVTGILLKAWDIHTPTASLHQHSTAHDVKKHLTGKYENIAYVSDAGTPGINDPGGKLVEAALDHDWTVTATPGPNAAITALSASGVPTDKFTYLGFPPQKKGRQKFFTELAELPHTVVIYESKHRIQKTLEQLPPDRYIIVGRELTKMHETYYRGFAPDIMQQLTDGSSKGEFVIVIAPIGWNT